MPAPDLFDFREPLPMPAGAERLVAGLTDAAPRVGLLLGAAAGRALPVRCGGVRRVALVEVATDGDVWVPLECGLAGSCLLVLPAESAVRLADLLMGGTGETAPRPTTRLEQSVLLRHVVPALWPLATALADAGVTGLQAGPISDDPLPTGTGEVVAVLLEAVLPAGGEATLVLCLPARSLLPAGPERPTAVAGPAADVLGSVPVTVALRLPGATVAAADLAELSPGDVLRLDGGATAELTGLLPLGGARAGEDLPVLTATLGRRGRRRAVVVHELLGDPS